MPDHFYVYPSYLRRASSRSMGRRVAQAHALAEPTVEQIVETAKRLGFRAEPEAGKRYPREAHRFEGRVKVVKKSGVSKQRFLRELAEALRAEPRPGQG